MDSEVTKHLKSIFGGDSNEVDADLLVDSLSSYSSVAKEVAAFLDPGGEIRIRIKPPQEGSFEF